MNSDGGDGRLTTSDSPEIAQMTTISLHSFGDSCDNNDGFTIQIMENMREEYGMFVWPCSVILAEYVWQHKSRFSGASVVEVQGLTWGVLDAPVFDMHPNILLGADVLYDTSAFDDLFSTVAFLLETTPGSVFITTYHNRSGHHLIEFLMFKWGLKCIKLVDGFSFMQSDKASGLGGNIQLAEIVLDSS